MPLPAAGARGDSWKFRITTSFFKLARVQRLTQSTASIDFWRPAFIRTTLKQAMLVRFFLLTQAYEVLSNPERRAAYDAARQSSPAEPLSARVDFMDTMQGELNRRLAVLAVLYFQRRTSPNKPEVTFRDIENRLGFPRDYLVFTTWYLQTKGYISRADNSEFTITAEGVDFVETQRVNIPVLDKLLTTGAAPSPGGENDGYFQHARGWRRWSDRSQRIDTWGMSTRWPFQPDRAHSNQDVC